jgi:hypothetical protein
MLETITMAEATERSYMIGGMTVIEMGVAEAGVGVGAGEVVAVMVKEDEEMAEETIRRTTRTNWSTLQNLGSKLYGERA